MKEGKNQDHLANLEALLKGIDFSQESDREGVYQKTLAQINNQQRRDKKMKGWKGFSRQLAKAAAAFTIVILGVSVFQPSFAQSIYKKIISLGHIEGYLSEHPTKGPLPEMLAGKLYDSEGKLIETYEALLKVDQTYNEAGEPVTQIDEYGIRVGESVSQEKEVDMLVVTDQEAIQGYTNFQIKLPNYLPEGYAFDRVEFYQEGQVVSPDYVNLYFLQESTGNFLFLQQRTANEETAFSFGAEKDLEEVALGKYRGILGDGRNLYWEQAGVLYALSTRGHLSQDEILRIGESIF